MQKFIAITGLGWGNGETIGEAVRVYKAAQIRNFPSLKTKDGAEMLNESWGFVWETPEGATGYFMDYDGLTWQFPGNGTAKAQSEDRRGSIGTLPGFFEADDPARDLVNFSF